MRFSATTMVMAVMTVAAFMMGTALLSTREHQAGSVNTYIAVHFIACSLFLSLFLSFFLPLPFVSLLPCFSLFYLRVYVVLSQPWIPTAFARLRCTVFVCLRRIAAFWASPLFQAHTPLLSKCILFHLFYIFGSCRSRMLYQAIVTRRHYRTTLDPPLARALLATIVAFTARLWVRQPATSLHNTTSIYRYIIYCQSIIKRRVRMYHSY